VQPAGGAWYGINTAEPPVYPYIVHTRMPSAANVSLGGPSDLQNTRVQIDVFAVSIADALAVHRGIKAAMAEWALQNVPLTEEDIYEPDVRAWRISSDWSIWATT